jgi:putative acetyltransferase
VEVRAYTSADARATSVIFLRAVRETAPAHYSPAQVEDWAATHGDHASWAAARAAVHTLLGIVDGRVAGFTDLDDDGHIDMLFVDPDLGRRGVASTLLAAAAALAAQRGLRVLTAFASLTSRPVFERQGFVVVGERSFGEGDRAARTYAMRRVLDADPQESAAPQPTA